jgi:HlyD family secretion protein
MLRGFLIVLLLLASIGLYFYDFRDPSTAYITAPVERGHIATVVKATGTVNAKLAVDVSSQLSGRIAEVLVDFNDPVKAGQPIAKLDPESYAAKANEAKAALQVSVTTATLNRAAVERAQATVANAASSRSMSQAQLAAVQIKHEESVRELQRKIILARTGNVSESELSRIRTQNQSEEADLRANAEQLVDRL